VSFIKERDAGLGRHTLVIMAVPGVADEVSLRRWIFWQSLFILATLTLVKVSIGIFLLRLESQFRKLVIGMLGESTMYHPITCSSLS